MQRQDLIRHIIGHLPVGSLKGLNARGEQVVQLSDKNHHTQTFATLERLSFERLSELAMQLPEIVA